MGNKSTVRKVYRSAITGRYVSKKYALRHPNTTVEESVRVPRRRSKQAK